MTELYKYIEISEQEKENYKSQLQRDSSRDFDSEFIRTTDLEVNIVKTHGFDGIKFLFENENDKNFFELGKFPEDCPWVSLNDSHINDFIEINFNTIQDEIPNLLESMKDRCRFIYAEKFKSEWKLHYFLDMTLYDDREYFRIYTGGSPNPNPVVNENLKLFEWVIPKDLAQFYSIHDGFGAANNEIYVLNSSEITIMAKMMNPICQEKGFSYPEEYKFEDLLEFFPDGAGNSQCFYRKNSDSLNALTVDWDHETWEISSEIGFYEFIDERMSEIDEE